ncbi:hypothetical protein P3W85_26230 [Cupriavidus basilensis]|uniref:Uncharacterized protein n=1 Tax=Cupriavidus basilensis TaxID=68895 RepID=A0ABT6AUX9_9BURK|nr:hypothetical protein [Cupriavidus basilensis]MDF3836422.1 hypothetical protein [Cupriavidus basilensis]
MTRSSRPVATFAASPEPARAMPLPALPPLAAPPSVRQRCHD